MLKTLTKRLLTILSISALLTVIPSVALAASISPTSGATPDQSVSTSAGDEFWQVFPPDHSIMFFYSRGGTTFNIYQNTCTGATFCNILAGSFNQSGAYPVFHELNQSSSCFAAYPNMTYACLSADGTVDQFTYTATSCVGGCGGGSFTPWWEF